MENKEIDMEQEAIKGIEENKLVSALEGFMIMSHMMMMMTPKEELIAKAEEAKKNILDGNKKKTSFPGPVNLCIETAKHEILEIFRGKLKDK